MNQLFIKSCLPRITVFISTIVVLIISVQVQGADVETTDRSGEEKQMVRSINDFRTTKIKGRCGARRWNKPTTALSRDPFADQVATMQATEMANRGGEPIPIIDFKEELDILLAGALERGEAEYSAGPGGEIVGSGSLDEILSHWKTNPQSCRDIIEYGKNWGNIGVGSASGADGRLYMSAIIFNTVSYNIMKADLVIKEFETTGTLTINPQGDYEQPLRVKVSNQGWVPAGPFRIGTRYFNSLGSFPVAFTVPGLGLCNTWKPLINVSLHYEGTMILEGIVVFPSTLSGQTVELYATADDCSGEVFENHYCDVMENNEKNNSSESIPIYLHFRFNDGPN